MNLNKRFRFIPAIFAFILSAVMFVSAPGNQVIALDAQTGIALWRYRRELAAGAIIMHPVSRGVALYGSKVFFASNAAVLVALDAKTGNELWTTTVEDNKKGYYFSGAPVIADGKVVVGVSGGEWGIRGFVAAFDVEAGKELWRTFTIPAPGEPGQGGQGETDACRRRHGSNASGARHLPHRRCRPPRRGAITIPPRCRFRSSVHGLKFINFHLPHTKTKYTGEDVNITDSTCQCSAMTAFKHHLSSNMTIPDSAPLFAFETGPFCDQVGFLAL